MKLVFSFCSCKLQGGAVGAEIDDLINECFGYKDANLKKVNQGLKLNGIQVIMGHQAAS